MKKRRITQLKSLILAIIIIVSLCVCPCEQNKVSANSISTAVSVPMNTARTGMLNYSSETLFYKFKTGNETCCSIILAPGNGDISFGWNIEIISSNMKTLMKYTSIKKYFVSSRICVGSNTEFYVKISAAADGSYTPVKVPFTLKASEVLVNGWEKENDDTLAKANTLNTNVLLKGFLWNNRDIDYYKYKFTKNGYGQIVFGAVDTSNLGYGWKISVYTAKRKLIATYDRIGENGVISGRFNFKKGTVIYIKVEASVGDEHEYIPYGGYVPFDKTYSIKVTEKNTKGWEKPEKNDSFKDATVVNSYKIGTLYTRSDVDFYRIKTTKTKRTIKMTVGAGDPHGGYRITVYNNKKKVLKQYSRDIVETGFSYKMSPGRTYYVKVECCSYYTGPIDLNYKIQLTK